MGNAISLFKSGLNYIKDVFGGNNSKPLISVNRTAQSTPSGFVNPAPKQPTANTMNWPVGGEMAGGVNKTEPGPTLVNAELMKTGEKYTTTTDTSKQKITPQAVAKLAINSQINIEKNNPTPQTNTAKATDLLKTVATAPQRVVAKTGISTAAGVLSLIKNKNVAATYQPKTPLERMLLGDEAITGIFSETDTAQKESESVLKKMGFDPSTSKGMAMAIAPLLVGGTTAVDVTPLGGEGKNAEKILQDIAKSKDEGVIFKGLEKIGIKDAELAKNLISVNTAEDVLKTISKDAKNLSALERAGLIKQSVYDAEQVSKMADNSLMNNPENKYLKPNRLEGEKLSYQEAKTGLTKSGENKAERIILRTNDEGKVVLEDGTHLLEAYRDQKIPIPASKIKFADEAAQKTLASFDTAKDFTNKAGINLNYYDLTPQEKEKFNTLINVHADEIITNGSTPSTFKSIIEKANKESEIMTDVLTKEDIEHRGALELNTRRKSNTLSKIIEDPKTPLAEKAVATKEFVRTMEILDSVDASLGKGLVFKKIMAGEEEKTISQEVIDRIIKAKKMSDDVVKRAESVDWNNMDSVTNFYREYVKPTWSEVWDNYRYNNMLSNPRTQARNLFNNIGQATIVRPITKLVQASVDAVTSIFKSKPDKTLFREVPIYMYNAIKSIPDASRDFAKAWKSGILEKDFSTKQIPLSTSKLYKTWNTWSKLMEGADKFFMKMISEGEKAALMARGVEKPVAEKEAKKMAEYSLFRAATDATKKSQQGEILRGIDAFTNLIQLSKDAPVLGKVSGIINPFIRTPMQFAKAWLEYSPLGVITIPGAKNKSEQLAKSLIGSAVSMYAYSKAMEDKTTWGVPADPLAKEEFFASDKKPFSVKMDLPGLGSTWVPMIWFGPLAYALALPAAIKYYTKDNATALTDSDLEKISRGSLAGIELLTQQTFLENIGNFLDVLTGQSDANISKNLAFMSSQAIPMSGLLRWVATITDPVYRKASGFADSIEAMIPGLSKDLPAYTLPTGETSTRDKRNSFLPFDLGIPKKEYEELLKLREEDLRSSNYILNEVDPATTKQAIQLMDDFHNAKNQEDFDGISTKLNVNEKLKNSFVALVEKQAKFAEATVAPYAIFKDDPKSLAQIIYTRFQMSKSAEDNDAVGEFIKQLKEQGLFTDSVFDNLESIVKGAAEQQQLETVDEAQQQQENQDSFIDNLNAE